MKVDSRRIQKQNKLNYTSGTILYLMNRDMRVKDNWALLYAQELSYTYQTELIVCYVLDLTFENTLRKVNFKIQALKEIKTDLQKLNIPFYVFVDQDESKVFDFIKESKIVKVVKAKMLKEHLKLEENKIDSKKFFRG